jgi:hypothetical protein
MNHGQTVARQNACVMTVCSRWAQQALYQRQHLLILWHLIARYIRQ